MANPKDDEAKLLGWPAEESEIPNEQSFPRSFDTNRIYGRLFQGAAPQEGPLVSNLGFDVLVLCAEEYQPSAERFPGVEEVIHMPTSDYDYIPPTKAHIALVWETARKVVRYLENDKAVLVTCMAGLNRSGLVSAISLHLWLGISGDNACTQVQNARVDALFNERFDHYVRSVK
jgi:protein-tyrosine phosphatase